MEAIFSEEGYKEMIGKLFVRFPSFQKAGAGAYKPGIANMEFFDQLAGHPHKDYRIIHVAGTNGKGSVSNMLASVLASSGYKVGLYTSPHILDFRERMRVISEGAAGKTLVKMVPEEYVWDYVCRWQDTFDHLDMSFFEITTSMALSWFSVQKVDWVVLETGLGGRLDSTNIVSPELSVITNIGLDHCDLLGSSLSEIAYEKAGIIKPKVPVVIGESNVETDPVFERKVLYTNLPEPEYMGDRAAIMSLITFADKSEPAFWNRREEIVTSMDLQGIYQNKNLRTALTVLEVLSPQIRINSDDVIKAIVNTAERTDFHGRWERLSDTPCVICDIGHNEHGLRQNFTQLEEMKASGKYTDLIIVYGSVADKDVDSVIHLFPKDAVYVFTQADSHRSLPAENIKVRYMDHCSRMGQLPCDSHCVQSVPDAVRLALNLAEKTDRPLVYIGGSTYVVSESYAVFK